VGYKLVFALRHTRVERRGPDHEYAEIKFKYSLAKMLVAVVQLLYALTTLYESRVHQIDRFGYAAFRLTVAPYAIMSLVNLVAGFFCPDFEELYLLNSSILMEARSRPDAQFGEVVGDLVEYHDGFIEPPDTYMETNIVNVDASFGLDEKVQRPLATITMLDRDHGKKMIRQKKAQDVQSSKLPIHTRYDI
jgi:hypothetical protein